MKYQLVSAPSKLKLEELINKYLEDGWMLYGNVVVIPIDKDFTKFYQGMTKER